ncbi:hypothetical protein B7463_g1738, partial [Scytalidium lignicola]
MEIGFASSHSRAAQEKLAELENASAPYEQQLVEAAKFIGVDLYTIEKEGNDILESANKSKVSVFHAREEWLLRWLLKKLQSPKDSIPRQLLRRTLKSIPLLNASRILNERRFTSILQQTVYDVQIQQGRPEVPDTYVSESSSTVQEQPTKVSKKRKRSGELVKTTIDTGNNGLAAVVESIFCFVNDIISSSNPIFANNEDKIDASFSVECMRSVIRTSGDESAKVLGSWLSICEKVLYTEVSSVPTNAKNWLSPFITIWESHAIGNGDMYLFSQSCTKPLLSLLRILKEENHSILSSSVRLEWITELEQFVARHIILPAKAAGGESNGSDFETVLGEGAILLNSDYAPIMFNIAIRSLKLQGPRKWRLQDEKWLQTTFTTFRNAISSMDLDGRNKAIYGMLENAMHFKLNLDLSILKSITLEYALLDGYVDWKVLAIVMQIDINTFLIPNDEDHVLQNILARITQASLNEEKTEEISKQVVLEVLIPLMRGFSKARDLSGFIRHWYSQTVELERLRKELKLHPTRFSVWEDEDLQAELSELFEASLTTQQIGELLDWLASQVSENGNAVFLILDAIASSIREEEVVDYVGLRLYHIMFDDGHSQKLSSAYIWRSWRVLSKTLGWVSDTLIPELEDLWKRNVRPFDELSATIPVIDDLKSVEIFRCVCACWDIAKKGGQMEETLRPLMQKLVDETRKSFGDLVVHIHDDPAPTEVNISAKLSTYSPGKLWVHWSLVRCIFSEHPKVLELCSDSPDDSFTGIIKSMFDLATSEKASNSFDSSLRSPQDAFSELLLSGLADNFLLNSPATISHIIDILLSGVAKEGAGNNVQIWNEFAINCLLRLPLEAFSKKQREHVLGSWMPKAAGSSLGDIHGGVYASILSLKLKVMQRPMVYKDMKFKDLIQLAQYLVSEIPKPRIILSLFRELVKLTLSFVVTNIDQPWNRTYLLEAIQFLKERIDADKKCIENNSYTLDTLSQAVATTLISHGSTLNRLDVVDTSDHEDFMSAYSSALLSKFKTLLHKPSKYNSDDSARSLSLLSTMSALEAVGFDEKKLAKRVEDAQACITSMHDLHLDLGKELATFMAAHTHLETPFQGLATAASGRRTVCASTSGLLEGLDEDGKLQVLRSLMEEAFDGPDSLENLLAARHIIVSCQDTRRSNDASEDVEYDLSVTYSQLCSHMWKTTSIRQFCLITEIMEMMLRTKGRALSQWNIDSTFGSVAITCSRNGPSLNQSRAGTIYLHLCRLLQVVLTNHRLKTQGHFHLVVQTMQSLLRCFFTPLTHTNKAFTKRFPPPPWLSTRPQHQLAIAHSTAYTRLLTLICDPSVSTVTRSQHNSLTSATDKAKRIAGQYMQSVLTTYIKFQLEMKMKPEVREKMVPGLYAIFDTTTVEMRRMIGDGLDSSGRALFGTLVRDYQKFGKWKGG